MFNRVFIGRIIRSKVVRGIWERLPSGLKPIRFAQFILAFDRSPVDSRKEINTDYEKFDKSKESVFVVSHEGSRTGAPILSYNIILELLPRYNVVALFLGGGPVVDIVEAAGAVVILLDSRLPGGYDFLLKKVVGDETFKFAIVNSIESRSTLPAFARAGIPSVALVHEFASNTRPVSAFGEVAFWADKVVFSTDITRDNAVDENEVLNRRELAILPQGRCVLPIDSDSDGSSGGGLAKKISAHFSSVGPVVLGVGTVHYRKGVDIFLACAARALQIAPGSGMRFIWVGKGFDPVHDIAYSVYLNDQLKRSGLEESVLILDEVSDLAEIYATADIMLLTSRLDPLPNVAIDALSEAIPVICFDRTTGIADFLKSNNLADECVAGYLDIDDMVRKLVALSDLGLRESVSERSSAYAREAFNMSRYVHSLEQLIGDGSAVKQRTEDTKTILESGLVNREYFTGPDVHHATNELAVDVYLRYWSFGPRRKLFPGFDPVIYESVHGVAQPLVDPLADYIRSGRPEGPWDIEVISDKSGEVEPSALEAVNICLHLHVYYLDLLPQIMSHLMANIVKPDLMVSVTSEESKRQVLAMLATYSGKVVAVRVVPNRGRDIGPFLTGFAKEIMEGYKYVGHIHTKKTADLEDSLIGERWFSFILENLLGNEETLMADRILSKMASDSSVGMVFPDDPSVIDWGENRCFAEQLLAPLGLTALDEYVLCPIGTMFWASVEGLRPFFELNLDWEDYPAEPLPYDGSILHAIERLMPVPMVQNGYKIVTTNVSKVSR